MESVPPAQRRVSVDRFSVDEFRSISHPLLVWRQIDAPTLVLGSRQDATLVNDSSSIHLAQRRGGGGAVYLDSECVVWIDVWLPEADPCHRADVRSAMVLVGDVFLEALESLGVSGASVLDTTHHVVPTEICFAGTGPGEVMVGSNKLVGLTAWRGREGALFQAALYREQPRSLRDFMDLVESEPDEALATLASQGLGDIDSNVLLSALTTAFEGRGSMNLQVAHASFR